MAIDAGITRQGTTLRSVNAVRCGLVLGLIAFQSIEVSESYGRIAGTALWVVPTWFVAALFALAGFTAMRSVDRNGIATATARTAIRFVPILILVVVATAYGMGAAVTAEPRRSYLLDVDVASYLLNILGVIQMTLPGVFQFNPAAGVVNPIMAIVPVAYLATAVLAISATRPSWRIRVIGGVGALLAIAGIGLLVAGIDLGRPDGMLTVLLAGRGFCASLCFVVGALAYCCRRSVPIDWRLGSVACAALLLVAFIGNRSWSDNALASAAAAVPLAYLALYACSLPWPLRRWAPLAEPVLWRMLLLAYPIQQCWIALGPDRQTAPVNLALSLPVIVMFAVAAWLVERVVLRRFLPWGLPPAKMPQRRVLSASGFAEGARTMAPMLASAMLIILLMLAALAMAMFALQRDAGGA